SRPPLPGMGSPAAGGVGMLGRMPRRRAPSEPLDDALSQPLAHKLERWFRAGHRDMPWRRTRDPYAIWVSEIMLQQTRVETVERYYDAFMRRFPTVERLAVADEQDVLQAWSGLGYYRRARLLHRGAAHVVEHLGGQLPQQSERLREIPGVGAYTAGAIASIAFDRPEPLVDGNVARVLSRIEKIEQTAEQGATSRRHWRRVAGILRHGTPRMLSQALMELGATVCTPKSPRCLLCPVRAECGAHAAGRVDEIPAPRKKIPQPVSEWIALAVVWRRRVLLIRRPAEGLLADMWCLPLIPGPGPGVFDSEGLGARLSVAPRFSPDTLPPVRHVFTHRIWQLHPLIGRVPRKPRWLDASDDRQQFIAPGQRPDGGMPRVTEKLLERIGF
ncbi:MAG: A/G-specific adenine glycosylase, partial [Deltaproteobacteria bacterium]|nr:A/G-specific adenine glycosylase [Deltaproteobacteria bacterium]